VKEESSHQNIIIIAGMHRSGTSLTASLLEKSGLAIGDNLMSNGFDNKKGHFEDLEFLKIHENDLKLKSLDTRGLSGAIKSHLDFEKTTIDSINDILKSKKVMQHWGWKEPRTTLYLGAWKRLLPNIKCIAVFRHYDEVANSLVRRYNYKLRNGISMSMMVRMKHIIFYPIHILLIKRDAYRSWYVYNKSIVDFKAAYPDDIIIVELNHFTRNYNPMVEAINTRFNTELLQIEVDEILDDTLLTKKIGQPFKIRFFSNHKLTHMLTLLKRKSLWI
jgi:hypothetical protein